MSSDTQGNEAPTTQNTTQDQPALGTHRPPSTFGVNHPLAILTREEIAYARALLVEAGHLREGMLVPRLMPIEVAKDVVLAHVDGEDDFTRAVEVTLLDVATGTSTEYDVDLTHGAITREEELNTTEFPHGQPQYTLEEMERVDTIVKADERWQQAMARRGITDTSLTFVSPLAPGYFPEEGEVGRRYVRSLSYHRRYEGDNPWSHPVEGLLAIVDLTENAVIRIIDEGDIPVPMDDWGYTPEEIGPPRDSLKPLEILQPEGPSFTVTDGTHVEWENWKMRVGFTQQEGLVLHQISFRDGDEDRPIMYRMSVPEMVVPYGDQEPTRFWISYFDAGEYHLGGSANSLKLGCDCLGVIRYFDAHLADDRGNPVTIEHAVCMHEEDYGILYKHTEPGEPSHVRRSRRLVLSYFATIGNYDYGFFYYFYLDGSIEVEAKATGIVFAGAEHPGNENPFAPEIAPGILAPIHQHIFCARMDMQVDGVKNSVEEENILPIPMGPENPYGNSFNVERTPVRSEKEGVRDANSETGRKWYVTNPERTNHVGKPTSYVLLPYPGPRLLAAEGSSARNRAQFATHHLWATQYDAAERFPAGKYPGLHAGDGIAKWVEQDRSLEQEDVVLWHTFGPTHVPRPEDWPIMPVDYYGFWLKPYGFFDKNPAMDLPDWSTYGGKCCGTEDVEGASCSHAHGEGGAAATGSGGVSVGGDAPQAPRSTDPATGRDSHTGGEGHGGGCCGGGSSCHCEH